MDWVCRYYIGCDECENVAMLSVMEACEHDINILGCNIEPDTSEGKTRISEATIDSQSPVAKAVEY